MSFKLFHHSKKFVSFVTSFVLLSGIVGCSPNTDQPVDVNTPSEPSSVTEDSVSEVVSSGKITDNGQPICDFDEFVNGELYDSFSGNTDSITYDSSAYLDYIDHVKDMLDTSDISSLSEEDGLYKVVTLYNELTDHSDKDSRLEGIKEYLQPINDIKSLNDLYDLYSRPEYAISNYLIYIDVRADFQWNNLAYVGPKSDRVFLDMVRDSADKQSGDISFRIYLNQLGYDDSRIDELLSNAFEVEDKIDEFLNSDDYLTDFYYFNSEGANEEGLTVPLVDIIGNLNGYGTHGYILCNTPIFDFYNNLFAESNIYMLRDYLIASSLWVVYFSGYDFINITQAGRSLSVDEIAVMYLMSNAPDVIAGEMMKKYYSDQDLKDINSLLLQIKTSAIGVVGGTDWLSDDAKDLAKVKISRLIQNIGKNGHQYFLNGYLMEGNPVTDLIGLRADSFRFDMIQTYFSDTDRSSFGFKINTSSAYYYWQYNCLNISAGLLTDLYYTGGDSLEEKLGYFGVISAHEIGHSSDSSGILYDETGYYNPIITDDDYDAYMEKLNSIKDFFEGKSVYDDIVISGETICDETYADLFAIQTCLNILAQTDDPDYDLFFRTYARVNYGFYGESDIDTYSADVHLMAKARINYVLGQFDEFYETYDIDESSPYYVPENERLRIF